MYSPCSPANALFSPCQLVAGYVREGTARGWSMRIARSPRRRISTYLAKPAAPLLATLPLAGRLPVRPVREARFGTTARCWRAVADQVGSSR